MHLALYRSERPERFSEIIGQKHIVRILQNQLKTGTVSQSYLFTGTRGTGKTTTARILAKAVNCIGNPPDGQVPCGECPNCKAIRDGNFLDVIELDAASNNGVDDLRAIIESVKYPPTLGKYKVYIIDEVHMLSTAAENAFLKTLEEPPEYAIFILATTNPEKVRPTIRSRCMTLQFRRVAEADLVSGMQRICEKKHIQMTPEALALIAQRSDGSVRDALSILEQCISTGEEVIQLDDVLDAVGSAGLPFYLELTQAVIEHSLERALRAIADMIRRGRDAKQMLADWLAHYRDLMIVKYVEDPRGIVNASPENIARMRAQAENLSSQDLERAIRTLSEYVNLGRYSTQPRILLETAALHLMNGEAKPADGISDLAKSAAGVSAPGFIARPYEQVQAADASAPAHTGESSAEYHPYNASQSNDRPKHNDAAGTAPPSSGTSAPDIRDRVPSKDATVIQQNAEMDYVKEHSPSYPSGTDAPAPESDSLREPDRRTETMETAASSPVAESETPGESAPDTFNETEASAVPPKVAPPEASAHSLGAAPPEASASAPDLKQMWARIAEAVSRNNSSFQAMVAPHSYIESYRNDEIVLRIKKNKFRVAELSKEALEHAVKELFGPSTFITLKKADEKPRDSGAAGIAAGVNKGVNSETEKTDKRSRRAAAAGRNPEKRMNSSAPDVRSGNTVNSQGEQKASSENPSKSGRNTTAQGAPALEAMPQEAPANGAKDALIDETPMISGIDISPDEELAMVPEDYQPEELLPENEISESAVLGNDADGTGMRRKESESKADSAKGIPPGADTGRKRMALSGNDASADRMEEADAIDYADAMASDRDSRIYELAEDVSALLGMPVDIVDD